MDAPEPSKKIQWIPITLLTASCLGLAAFVPIFLSRRRLPLAPPPRRSATATIHLPRSSAIHPTPIASASSTQEPSPDPDDFNRAFYAAKALGISTMIVATGATLTVWGVKSYMGIQDAQQFGDRMRAIIIPRIPDLSSRIHKALDPSSDPTLSPPVNVENWNWPDAEKRLNDIYEKEGAIAWAEAALREAEAEVQIEKKRRRDIVDQKRQD
ncbi:hypothetical protein C8J56DRAFT_394264 [Mycena floridula]|nr:hypothetical protein C8J56DRAFT_394264 [Mycena floridula]